MAHVAVNGTRLWVQDHGGPGVPIVFSHSLFFDSAMFEPLARAFETRFRVITYDHRAQGQSLAKPGEELGMDVLAEDAACLIEHLGAAPCHFVGNSLGGFVALRLAIRRPELLRSAAILGSSAEAEHRLAEFAPVVQRLRADGPGAMLDTLMFIMFGDSFLADPQRADERSHWRDPAAG
jgi:3-oxoadipate enol-lactonase